MHTDYEGSEIRVEEGMILKELNRQEDLIQKLDGCISGLEMCLMPVIKDFEPTNNVASPSPENHSRVGTLIYLNNENLSDNIIRINTLMGRIDI